MKCPKCGSDNTKVRQTRYGPSNLTHMECQSCGHRGNPNKDRFVDVPIDLSDEDFTALAKMAHEQDITFNQLCVNILREQMEKEEKSLEAYRKTLYDSFLNSHPTDNMTNEEVDIEFIEWLERKLYDNDVPVKP